jgi:hypothetical protein
VVEAAPQCLAIDGDHRLFARPAVGQQGLGMASEGLFEAGLFSSPYAGWYDRA